MIKKRTLLIVDDEVEILEVLRDQLESPDLEVRTASNGQVALELAQKQSFDAILSDLSMPQMNGLELLKALRDEGNLVPFVILTAFGDKSLAIKALRLGAFDFLEKPIVEADLLEVIDRAVELGEYLRFWGSQPNVRGLLESMQNTNSERALKTIEKLFEIKSVSDLRKKNESSN